MLRLLRGYSGYLNLFLSLLHRETGATPRQTIQFASFPSTDMVILLIRCTCIVSLDFIKDSIHILFAPRSNSLRSNYYKPSTQHVLSLI